MKIIPILALAFLLTGCKEEYGKRSASDWSVDRADRGHDRSNKRYEFIKVMEITQ